MTHGGPVWLDGRMVEAAEARFPFFSHSLHYGVAAFEGIRCYPQPDGGRAIFRLAEHVARLLGSAKACLIDVPFAAGAIAEGCFETVRASGLDACYVRPLVWLGEGPMGLGSRSNAVHVGIGAFPWPSYLGDEARERGIRCCVSSLTRISHRSHLTRAKIAGQYVNSVLAKRAAAVAGYDEALLVDDAGLVVEGSGENLFVVQDGVLLTPPVSAPILPGITRATVLQLARERGLTLQETALPRDALYLADEVFLTGTAAEVTPVREIDGRTIGAGARGPVTAALQTAYLDAVHGRDAGHPEWLARVPG